VLILLPKNKFKFEYFVFELRGNWRTIRGEGSEFAQEFKPMPREYQRRDKNEGAKKM